MDEILINLRSPSWLFTAVVAGFIVSLASMYLKDWFDARRASWSSRRKALSEKEKEKRLVEVAQLRRDASLLQHYYFDSLDDRLRAAALTAIGFPILIIAFWMHEAMKYEWWAYGTMYLLGLIAIAVSFRFATSATTKWDKISESRKPPP